MWQRPFFSVGVLYHIAGSEPSFRGTCFAYFNKSHFLTAAHCVPVLRHGGATTPLNAGPDHFKQCWLPETRQAGSYQTGWATS